MLMIEYAPEESEYNKSCLYREVLIDISDYTSTHFPHLTSKFISFYRVLRYVLNLYISKHQHTYIVMSRVRIS